MGRRKGPASSPGLSAEKQHVIAATKELVGITKRHQYLVGQMVPAMQMVCSSGFRYSAPLVPWTGAELEDMQRVCLLVHKAGWLLPPGYPGAPFLLLSRQSREPIGHPRVVLTYWQALAKHIELLVALQDDLRTETIARYKQLCDTCGCCNEQELSDVPSAERKPRRCPLARFLRVCGQLGVQARLPARLSPRKAERDTSWHSLLMHLSRRASASDADEDFCSLSDLELVMASWAAIRRCFRGHGIKQPRQLVLDPWARPAIWLLPHSIRRRPHWLDALRRVLPRVDAAALFPRLDRGMPPHGTISVSAPAHQVLLHEVIVGLRSSLSPVARLFEIGL
jgi:hypothetical protein